MNHIFHHPDAPRNINIPSNQEIRPRMKRAVGSPPQRAPTGEDNASLKSPMPGEKAEKFPGCFWSSSEKSDSDHVTYRIFYIKNGI